MEREQRDQYLENAWNIDKMRHKKYSMDKTYRDFPNLQVSFYTRYSTMEYCFGDPNEEQPNVAYSILKSIKKVLSLFIINLDCS